MKNIFIAFTIQIFANLIIAQNTTGLSEINKDDLIKNVL